MRSTIAIMAAAAGLLISTAAHADSKTYDLSGFDRIDVATGLDAVVKQGDSFSVIATSSSAKALDNLQLTLDGGVLAARLDQNFLDFIISGGLVGMLLSNGNAVTIEVTLPALSAIDASSGADVRATGITATELDLKASSGAGIEMTDATLGLVQVESSSGADVDISGTADAIEARASSGADIDAEELTASSTSASASSGADVSVHATESIKAEASSGGDISVYGNPADRDVDTSSGGEVHFND